MQVEAWLERAAAAAPSRTAVEGAQGALTYSELHAWAHAGADVLRARGVGEGERVAIGLPAGIEFVQALHSCLLLGAVAVPLDLRHTRSERERIAQGARVVVEESLSEPPGRGDDGGRGAPGGFVDTDMALRSEGPVHGGKAPPRRGVRHDLDAVALVIHTSGTTSAPKPVELTYGNLLWSALGSAVALGRDPDERWLCALPLSHVGGLSILLRSAIYGTTAVIHERFDTERVLNALRSERITLVSLVSTTLARLLDAGLREPPHLRCALTGGGPVPAALTARACAAGVPVCETYGLTECCSQAATAPPGVRGTGAPPGVLDAGAPEGVDAPEGARVPEGAGAPLFCTSIRIAPDGEILLSGPTVAPGALDPDGWLHTGDLGHLDERGFLHVSGRKADTIVSGGENVSPTEVEAVLERHPGVIEAAVLGREDEEWGEAVHAIVVVAPRSDRGEPGSAQAEPGSAATERVRTESGSAPTEAELREHCARTLAPFKVPKRFTLVSHSLPRTASGKLLRRELQGALHAAGSGGRRVGGGEG